MNSDASTTDDPFALNPLDEETELRALSRTIQFGDGFALIFVRCNQPPQRKRLLESLRKDLPQINVQEIDLNEPITNLLDELRGRIKDIEPDVVFVSGLEYSLPSAAEAHLTPFIANLNAARNSFPIVIRHPLVLWVADYVLTAVARGAPDFFSIRSGVYYFAATPNETIGIASSLTGGDEAGARNLSLNEKQERIKAIESLLADYQSLPDNQRDYRTQARLRGRLGVLFSSLGNYAPALDHFAKAVSLAKQLEDPSLEAFALHGSARTYSDQGRLTEAETAIKEAMELWRQSGNRLHEGIALNNLGNIYFSEGREVEAEKVFQESLDVLRQLGSPVDAAISLANLGRIYARQKRWEEAEKAFQESLAILREVGDRSNEASALYHLGSVYNSQGRFSEARSAFEQAILIAHELGDRTSEGNILTRFAFILATQEQFEAALEVGRRGLALLEATESRSLLESARAILMDIERQAADKTLSAN